MPGKAPIPADDQLPVFTYPTRVFVTPGQDEMLRQYASGFGYVERRLFADIQRGENAHHLKSEYLARFGITARQFNALRVQLQGKVQSVRELLPLQIEDLKTKLKKAKKRIAKIGKKLRSTNTLHQKRRRLARLEHRLKQLERDRKEGRIRICFGSNKLFRAQFYPETNGFKSHAEWKAAFTAARSNQFFVLGSKDETAGCQGCVALREEDGSYLLRVRLPNSAREKHGVIRGIRFVYGQEEFEEALACGRALSYRFLRDDEGWRIFVAMEASPKKRITDRRLGAIGIDINPDQLVLAEVDRFGNFNSGEHLACVTYGKRKAQAKAIIGAVVKLATTAALCLSKPIIVERLEFAKKKAALEGEGRRRARMLSSFAYHGIIQHLKAAAFRAGVQIIEVNPAYTSTIGAVNYAAQLGISVHQGAAIAIARRGLGLSERPAKRVVHLPTREGDHGTFPLPVRNRGKHVWSFWAKVARQIRAALAAPVRLLPERTGSTPTSLCCQTPCAT